MKIQSSAPPTTSPLTYGRIGKPASSGLSVPPAAVSIERSDFLAELHAASQGGAWGEVRPEVVATAKADIAAGRLGGPEDLERTVNALLREL